MQNHASFYPQLGNRDLQGFRANLKYRVGLSVALIMLTFDCNPNLSNE